MKNNTIIYVARASNSREIASMISVVACCHGAKLCTHAARDFRLQHHAEKRKISIIVESARRVRFLVESDKVTLKTI